MASRMSQVTAGRASVLFNVDVYKRDGGLAHGGAANTFQSNGRATKDNRFSGGCDPCRDTAI
jgi:hypothetical protein